MFSNVVPTLDYEKAISTTCKPKSWKVRKAVENEEQNYQDAVIMGREQIVFHEYSPFTLLPLP